MDPFYRYKVPQLVVKVETSKTVLINIEEICKSINRLTNTVLKFLSYELGVHSMYKHKLYSLNGHHNEPDLTRLLIKFIATYVKCNKCRNPETILCINGKKEVVFLDCTACGHIHNVPQSHNLTQFLIKGCKNRKKAPVKNG